MNVKERIGSVGRACMSYAMEQPDKKLSKLSPKKRTALEAIVYSMDGIKSLTNEIKKSWFGWSYLTIRLIKDSEVDQLVLSGHYAAETYMMVHFANDFVNSLPESKKAMGKALFSKYLAINNKPLESNPIVKEFQAYVI